MSALPSADNLKHC